MNKSKIYSVGSLALLSFACVTNAAKVVHLQQENTDVLKNFTVESTLKSSLVDMAKPNRLVKLKETSDTVGNIHTRYQQFHNNIPVYQAQVIIHKKNRNGFKPQSIVNGKLVEDINLDKTIDPATAADPQLVLAKTKEQFVKKSGLDGLSLEYKNEVARLVYYIDQNQKAQLGYEISFFVDSENKGNPARPFYLIDAKSGNVIKEWNGLTHQVNKSEALGTGPGGNNKTGKYVYGKDFGKLVVTVNETNNTCSLEDNNTKTVHMHGGNTAKAGEAFEFKCYKQNSDAINGGFSPLNDAHYFGGVIFNMYKDWYNTAPLTFQLTLNTHYGDHYENAFWDGTSMTFGDGADMFYPLVGLDVVAHEVSHGFTEQNSNLQYWGQSGGINEAFSDMAGKAAEFFMRKTNTWGIGDEITKEKEPLRYMDHPEKDGYSIGNAKDYDDWLDVHFSSGVYNRAFYLLATTKGWDTKKAFDVMVQANANYWTASSDFADAAAGVVEAAKDLDYNANDVKQAFKKVGINCNDKECEIAEDAKA